MEGGSKGPLDRSQKVLLDIGKSLEVARHWLYSLSLIVQKPMLRSRIEMKVSPSILCIISWMDRSGNGQQRRWQLSIQKLVMKLI